MNKDEIVSKIYTIDKFFCDKYKYKIPDFQRSYTWELKEINDFLLQSITLFKIKVSCFLEQYIFTKKIILDL